MLDCETLCGESNSCAADNRHSLADLSYVPHHRRISRSLLNESVGYDEDVVDNDDDKHDSILFPRQTQYYEDKPELKLVTSDEDAKHVNDLSATLETIREFSRGILRSDHVDEEEHHHHGHHSDNDTDDEEEDEEGACSNVEFSWNEHCYFLTKEPVPGYRAATTCLKAYSSAQFSEIENEIINQLVSEHIQKLDENSGKPPHKRIIYVYIKDDHENADYRETKLNPQEELFKKSICDLVGCQCTALRSITGSWHTRICDTRHYALCKRPHRHEHEEAPEISTPAPVADSHDEQKTSAATLTAGLSLTVALAALLSTAIR